MYPMSKNCSYDWTITQFSQASVASATTISLDKSHLLVDQSPPRTCLCLWVCLLWSRHSGSEQGEKREYRCNTINILQLLHGCAVTGKYSTCSGNASVTTSIHSQADVYSDHCHFTSWTHYIAHSISAKAIQTTLSLVLPLYSSSCL